MQDNGNERLGEGWSSALTRLCPWQKQLPMEISHPQLGCGITPVPKKRQKRQRAKYKFGNYNRLDMDPVQGSLVSTLWS